MAPLPGCAHTEKTNLFPSWLLGQTPTVCSLWRWYKNFYLKLTEGFDIPFPCELFWGDFFQSNSAFEGFLPWKILSRVSRVQNTLRVSHCFWDTAAHLTVVAACGCPAPDRCIGSGCMFWGCLECRGPTYPYVWFLLHWSPGLLHLCSVWHIPGQPGLSSGCTVGGTAP